MIIHEPELELDGVEVVLKARIEAETPGSSWPDTLWFRYPVECAGFVSDRADAFLSALVLAASVAGEDIVCGGTLSPRLVYGLDEYSQIYHRWAPKKFHPVRIVARKLKAAPPPKLIDQYAVAFSGGVGSFFTLYAARRPGGTGAGWPVTHALYMLGAADIPLIHSHKYDRLLPPFRAIAQSVGVELLTASTNLMLFSAREIGFASYLEAPLIGCALGLGGLFSGLLMNSGRTYENYTLDSTGPITAHLLSTETLEAMSSGSGFTRHEKVAAIADWEPVQENLRVCMNADTSDQDGNCSYCSKCLRTRMDLHVLGKLNKFSTFIPTFGVRDTLLWGRWLETGYGWEWRAWTTARKNMPGFLPLMLIGIAIGTVRSWLRRHLPQKVMKLILKFSAEPDPYALFTREREPGTASAGEGSPV